MVFKKKYKIAVGVILTLAFLIFLASIVVSKIISNKVTALLEEQNIENLYLSIERTKFSFFDRSLVFSDIHLGPTESAMIQLKNNEHSSQSLHKLSISRLKLRGIQLSPLIFKKQLKINKLIIDDPLYQQISSDKKPKKEVVNKHRELDSIHLKKLEGFQLDLIKITNLKIQKIDIHSDKITFQNKPLDFEVTGFKLDELSEDYFKLSPVSELFEMTRIKVDFPNIKYSFSIDKLNYHFGDDHLQISNLKFKPMVNKLTLANSYLYNTDIIDVEGADVKVYNVDLEKAFENKGFYMDSVIISNLSAEIYKDKRKPFDLNKRPQFPHQLLKEMKTPLLIQKVSLRESKLVYEEKLEHAEILMKVSLEDLKINLFNVTSIKSKREVPMKVDLSSKFMGKANLHVDMILPLKTNEDTFYFSGFLGPSKMTYYDSAIIPAIGLKVLNGDIQSLSFHATGNSYNSHGKMIFKYNNLEGEVFKLKKAEKNNFLSWSVNNLVHKSNPGKNGELREATMKFDRVLYKGFGNLFWKTVQSGIVNTIAPFGMTTEKEANKRKRQLKREERRKRKNK
ncbi:MAG: hypothetical protein ACR2MV_10655 [Lutimonas sp.]